MNLKSKFCAITGHRELQTVQLYKRTQFVRFYQENNNHIYYSPHNAIIEDGKFKCLGCNAIILTTKRSKKPIKKNYV